METAIYPNLQLGLSYARETIIIYSKPAESLPPCFSPCEPPAIHDL